MTILPHQFKKGGVELPGRAVCDRCGTWKEAKKKRNQMPSWYTTDKSPSGWLLIEVPNGRNQHYCKACRKALDAEALQRKAVRDSLTPVLAPGMVCTHEDREGHHWAVLLKVQRRTCVALFFVSKPLPGARPRTAEESALAGFSPNVRKDQYLWLVERPKIQFVPRGAVFPEHRVAALREEFGVRP